MLFPEAADADVVAGDATAFGVSEAISLPLSASEASASSIRDDDYADRLQVLQRLVAQDPDSAAPLLVTAYVGGAMQLVPTPESLKHRRAESPLVMKLNLKIYDGGWLSRDFLQPLPCNCRGNSRHAGDYWMSTLLTSRSQFVSNGSGMKSNRLDASTQGAKEVSSHLSTSKLQQWELKLINVIRMMIRFSK